MLLVLRPEGLYCEAGDFYVDPWRPVERAIITHAHSDHARWGHRQYLAHRASCGVLRARLGSEVALTGVEYGAEVIQNGVKISLHPAGHVLGSAQVRVEQNGEVWVVSGDYKLHVDPTCNAFEVVRCHAFISEATFGLPIYQWPPSHLVVGEMLDWWRRNAAAGKPSVMYAYAFGKAQRILASLSDLGAEGLPGPILVHGAVDVLNAHYLAENVSLPQTFRPTDAAVTPDAMARSLVVAPPSAMGTSWLRRFKNHSDAYVSGWMQVRGARRRRNVDRGFVMSDHADWNDLNHVIRETEASRIFVTHGENEVMARWLSERGLDAQPLKTEFGDDELEASASAQSDGLEGSGSSAGRATSNEEASG